MLHSQLRLQQLKKKKKMFRSHVDHFEWSNEFYKIFLRIIRVILLQSFLTCFFQFILLRLQNWNIPLLTLSTKENFVESFFKSIIFFCDYLLYFYLLHSRDTIQGKIVENGIFEKKRLENSDRYVSHISTNFGNIVRYIKGQYSLMKTKAARSERRNFKIEKIIVPKDYIKKGIKVEETKLLDKSLT